MNTKTAKKEFRKNQRNKYRNTLIKQNARKIKKKILNPTGELTAEKAQQEFSKYVSIMHKIAKKRNILHVKTTSRLISRMAKKLKVTQVLK